MRISFEYRSAPGWSSNRPTRRNRIMFEVLRRQARWLTLVGGIGLTRESADCSLLLRPMRLTLPFSAVLILVAAGPLTAQTVFVEGAAFAGFERLSHTSTEPNAF